MQPDIDHPDEWTALARIVCNQSLPEQERGDALRKLQPLHQRLASKAMGRYGRRDPGLRNDLASEPELKLWIGKYRPEDGPYPPWAATVINNRMRTVLREEQRRPEVELNNDQHPVPDTALSQLAGREDWRQPFSAADLAQIVGWPPPTRLVVLCRYELWPKVPAPEWSQWLNDLGINPPFPPNGTLGRELEDQNQCLADALGVSRSQINTYASRGSKLLRELDFVVEIHTDHRGKST